MGHFIYIIIIASVAPVFFGCSRGGGGEAMKPDFTVTPDTPFTIRSEQDLIGGPLAQGRVGDVLLANDKIRVIIQKPRKNAGINSFGGNIIDADIARPKGGSGQDNFGSIFPLVNVEWTLNYHNYEVVSSGSPKVLRAYGKIDVYDYLDLDFIGEVAEGVVGQRISYSNRFDDRRNPFDIYDDLKGLNQDVVTDYILEDGANYVRIETTFTNGGSGDVKLPVGQFINGSGELSVLIPGLGFTPDPMTQVGGNTPAIIYAAFDTSDVSYGYFYPAGQFIDPKKNEPYTTTSVSYSGLTGLLLGEEFLKLAPLGTGGTPDIHFSVPAGGTRKITGYFVVGGGSAGSVLDSGLKAIGASTRPISGRVINADGEAVAGATVAVMSKGQTLITYRTDTGGSFAGNLPTGGNLESKRFGKGLYTIVVDMPGYHLNGTRESGLCEPSQIDLTTKGSASVECRLGETGTVAISGPVTDAGTGKAIPARLTIVGEDPSPNKMGAAGRFRSSLDLDHPFGIAGLKYITALGTFDLTDESSFPIEPGPYRFVISHGPEYEALERVVDVASGGVTTLEAVKLKRVVTTPGFVSADFHVHSIRSPDSSIPQELRVLSAAAEGLDVLQSSDHDYITDYAPVAAGLVSRGIIPQGSIKTSAGDELTPNQYGHIHAFPFPVRPDDPEGGAFDWSASEKDEVSPSPDLGLPLGEIIKRLRGMPGERVIQIDHIMDNPTGLLLASGWVTTPFYIKDFGVMPLSSYADPVERRLPPRGDGGTSFPIPFGASSLVITDFDSIELMIGPHLNDEGLLFRSALPTWFNLLNLGIIVTATADSDTHRTSDAPEPIGMPRNYILSSVDPNDGRGADHSAIDLEEYAANIKAHRVTLSAGPIVMMRARSEGGASAEIGQTLTGRHIQFTVDVNAPSWGWFDTIEIYANTEPIPADDKTGLPMTGTAADPAKFYMPYHVPRYVYDPIRTFKLSDGTILNWKEEGGRITAGVQFEMDVDEDTWVVAVARGTRGTKGYHSLFPIVMDVLVDKKSLPETFDPQDLSAFHGDKGVGAPAWGMTNPIFIDQDGDGFKAKYVRNGMSPVK